VTEGTFEPSVSVFFRKIIVISLFFSIFVKKNEAMYAKIYN